MRDVTTAPVSSVGAGQRRAAARHAKSQNTATPTKTETSPMVRTLLAALALGAAVAAPAVAQTPACPDKNLMYWQAFPPGGESDLSARHQQVMLKKKCAAIETVIQYKAGAGGGLLWSQMNTLPGRRRQHRRRQSAAHGAAADGRHGLVQDRGRHAGVLVPLHARRAGCRRGETRSRTSPTSSRPRRPIPTRSTSAARGSTRPTTRPTNGSTGPSASRPPTSPTREPATCRSRCSATTSTAR